MEHLEKKSEPLKSTTSLRPSELQSQESSFFQFQDNRPQAIAQRKLQQTSNNSLQAKSLLAIQKMANTRTSTSKINSGDAQGSLIMRTSQNNDIAPIQRAVITVNGDRLITDSAQIVADATGATAGAFAEVKPTETIYIFAHGYHSLTKPTDEHSKTNLEPELMGGITAADLCRMMISEGWTKKHKGPIDLRACMSGAESLLPSFAELFTLEIKKAGRSNIVTGYKELSQTDSDGSEISKKPTVSKMIQMAQTFDPSNFKDQLFAMEAVALFESKNGALRALRKKADTMKIKAFFIGMPPPGMSPLEWNVYSYYYAVSEKNTDLIGVLKGDFKAKEYQINQVENKAHDRQFNPDEMELPPEEESTGSDDDTDDLLARLDTL